MATGVLLPVDDSSPSDFFAQASEVFVFSAPSFLMSAAPFFNRRELRQVPALLAFSAFRERLLASLTTLGG